MANERRFPEIMVLAALTALSGCEQHDAPPERANDQSPVEARKPFLWRQIEDSTVVAIDEQRVLDELADATLEARATLEDARTRWSVATPAEQTLWCIKWAAPLVASAEGESPGHATDSHDESIEHVWVRPMHWSRFRIEGVLISQPVSPLASGHGAGDLVSFPVEQVSDWIHFASEARDSAYEGGYTVRVLEAHFGKVGSTSNPSP